MHKFKLVMDREMDQTAKIIERRWITSWSTFPNNNAMASQHPEPTATPRVPLCECCNGESGCSINCFNTTVSPPYNQAPVETSHQQQQCFAIGHERAQIASIQTETRGNIIQIQPEPISIPIEKKKIHEKQQEPTPPASAKQDELAVEPDRSGFQTPDQ